MTAFAVRGVLLTALALCGTMQVWSQLAAPCTSPPRDMVGWWPFDELEVSDGTSAEDLTGNGSAYLWTNAPNNGVVVGGVMAVPGVVSGGYQFSGTGSEYVSVPNHPELNVGEDDFSIDAWIFMEDVSDIRVIVEKENAVGSNVGWSLYIRNGNLSLQIGTLADKHANFESSGNVLQTGQWYHVAATVDRDNPEGGLLYINGNRVHQFNPTIRQGSLDVDEPLIIGRSISKSIYAIKGIIDEVELFKRALDSSEIAAIVQAGPAGKCKEVRCARPPIGMTGWWPLDEPNISAGTSIEDLTGNPNAYSPTTFANTGTVVGSLASTAGYVGGGFNFSGSGTDYVRVPNQAELNVGQGDFSVDAWVKLDDTIGVRVIVEKRNNTTNLRTKGWSFFTHYNGALALQMGDGTPAGITNFVAPANTALQKNIWYHVAATVERGKKDGGRLYVDGNLIHTFNPTNREGSLDVAEPLIIGTALRGLSWHGFDGVIDEVELFKRALTQSEIQAIYQAGKNGKCKESGDVCCVARESFSTGWDHSSGSVGAIGGFNSFWQVVADPYPLSPEPRPANIVAPYGQAWKAPLPGSQWISAETGSNYSYWTGTYEYRACICLCQRPGGTRLNLNLYVRTDNEAEFYIEGNPTPLFTTPSNSWMQLLPTHYQADIEDIVGDRSTVCLRVKVKNTGGPSGLNISGTLTALDANGKPTPALNKVSCCSDSGTISGIKFWDKNCDGSRDKFEPLLPGWTITAQGSSGTYAGTTDEDGRYTITVPSGTYTLTESQQPGWIQCAPTPPANQVAVNSGGTAVVDFGNSRVPPRECLVADSVEAICHFDSTVGKQYYVVNASFRSALDCNGALLMAQVISTSSSNGGAVAVVPGSFAVSTTPLMQSLSLSGSGAVPGALVKLVVKVCCLSKDPDYNGYCCTDTLTVRLPEKPCPSAGCFELVDDTVRCVVGPDGTTRWTYCFRVRNHSFFPASYLTLSGGVSFAPSTITLGTLAPGAVSGTYCVTINAAGPGFYSVFGLLQNAKRNLRCEQKWEFELPDCPTISCCPNFEKMEINHTPVAYYGLGFWGNAGIFGTTTVIGAECPRMTKVEATIERVSINNKPAWGYFQGPFRTLGGLVGGVVTTVPYGQRVVWGPMSPTTVSGVTHLRFQFPNRVARVDTVRWCVRYRFTDECCNTCDTLVCYSIVRRAPIFDWPPVRDNGKWFELHNQPEKESGRIQAAPSIGQIIGNDSAYLNVSLPDIPAVRFVELILTTADSAVVLREVTRNPDDLLFLTAEGVATSTFDLPPNTDLRLGLKYDDFGDRASIKHGLILRYVQSGAPEDTLEVGGPITLYREGVEGGDLLKNIENLPTTTQTFALHLQNTNITQQPIAQVAIRVPSGRKILAIGPTANDSTAVIGFRRRNEEGRYSATEIRGEEVVVPVGAEVRPIYLTVAGLQGNALTVDFITLNEFGEVISEGQVLLSTSSVKENDDRAVTGSFLSQSYPNPTDGAATIEFLLPHTEQNVELVVTDQQGKEVARLIDNTTLNAGKHVVWFNGTDLPSGTYYYTLRTQSGTETKQLQLVK